MVSKKTLRLMTKMGIIHKGKKTTAAAAKPRPTTLSIAQACAKYKMITEHDIVRHNIPVIWRRNFGNCTGAILITDLERLKRLLEEEAEEEKVQALKEKLGEDGYAKHAQEEKALAEQRAKDDAEFAQIKFLVQKVFDVGCSPTPLGAIELKRKTVSKSLAKKIWGVGDAQLEDLESTKEGRSVVYKLPQVINASLHMPVKNKSGMDRHAILLQKFQTTVQDSHTTSTFQDSSTTKTTIECDQNEQLQQLADYYMLQLKPYNRAKIAHVAYQLKETVQMDLERATKEMEKAHTNLVLQQRRGHTLKFMAVTCSEDNFNFVLPAPEP